MITVPIELTDSDAAKRSATSFTKNIEAMSNHIQNESIAEALPIPAVTKAEQTIPIVVTSSSGNASTSTNSGTLKARKDRNRTRSIRDRYKLPVRLPPPTIKANVMRKQEFQKGGQRAPIREYQRFFTTVHANLMAFFASEKDYNELNAANQPINLYRCVKYKLA